MARLVAALCCVLCVPCSYSATLSVPAPFRTIGEAVERARPGDTIEIDAGTYSPLVTGEVFPLRIEIDDLTVRGAGPDRTTLDACGLARHFVLRGSVRVEEMTLRGGSSSTVGGSISVERGPVHLERLVFTSNAATEGGDAIAWHSGNGRVANCLLVGNGPGGPTIRIASGDPLLEHLTWSANEGPALAVLGGRPTVRYCIVSRPGVPSGAARGVVLFADSRPTLASNLFDACYDGAVSFAEEAPRALLRLLDVARREDGTREGDPLFRRPERFDFRLREDSPALDGREIGAFGGENPLVLDADSSDAFAVRDWESAEPVDPILGPNVPNPFAPNTTVHFTMTEAAVVDLAVYNILGQRVRTLHAGDLSAGEHSRVWDGRDDRGVDAPGGIYFVRITRGDVTESRRIVLMR